MAIEITYHEQARARILSGMDQLADVIKPTLGPKGRTVMLQSPAAAPRIFSDAAAIAKDFLLENPVENMGAQVIREAVMKTGEMVGSGATTSAVLAQYMVREGIRNIAAGANPVELKKGMQGAAQLASAAIKRLSRPASTREIVAQAAAVSSGDPAVGAMVAEAMERVGRDGVVTVEESGGRDAVLHVEEGTQFDRGWLSSQMVTDQERMAAELDHPYILITDKKITSAQDLIPLLEQIMEQGRPLLIIADSVEGEALGLLAVNAKRGALRVVAVPAPAYGEGRRARLEDLAVLTGGELISEELGRSLRETTTEMLGSAASVRVDRSRTIITGGGGNKEALSARAASLRAMLNKTEYAFDRTQLEERLAKLTGGVAAIRVGAATEVELKEKKQRIETALQVARAAEDEGVVPGGGIVFIEAAPALRAYIDTLSGDRKTGAAIVLNALEAPARQIAENAGVDGGAVVSEIKQRSAKVGFDVMTETYVDMFSAGIIDPAKAARLALLHAASVAAQLLTVEAGVSKIGTSEE